MQKIKEYRMYLLAGALGIFTFIFSACSGIVWHWNYSLNWRATQTTYKFMDFAEGEAAYNSAGAFEILLIILSVALITFAVLGLLNKMGKTKISLGKLSIDDLLMYMTFAYVAFALAQVISAGAVIGENSEFFTDELYMHIGSGSLLMFFAGVALAVYQVLTKWVFKEKKTAKTTAAKTETTTETKPATTKKSPAKKITKTETKKD